MLCALSGAIALAACSKVGAGPASTVTTASAAARHAWTRPGELRIGIQREPNTLNPLLSANTTEGLLNRLTFDTLVSVDAAGKHFVPILAAEVPSTANGGISQDGLTITYKLRTGVKWHDGVPFTSKDVKFSWQAMMNDSNNVNSRVGYEDVQNVDTPDDATAVFHLKHKFAPFVATVFSESDDPVCIIPEHLLGKEKNVNNVAFNQAPVGTGPFKFVRWQRADHIELVANPDYFRGAPKLKSVTLKMIPDENTEINTLRTHDIDWMFEPSPNLYLILRQIERTGAIAIRMNDSPQTLALQINTSRPALSDIRVRRAIAYVVDKKSLADKFTGGSALPAGADQPPFSWSYEPKVMAYGPDPRTAVQLLRAAGYAPRADGIMVRDGQPLILQLSTNNENATRRVVETQIQAMLRTAGIGADIKNYPANIFFRTYGQGGILTTGKYDLAVSGWIAGYDPDDHSLFQCDQIPRPSHPDGVNYTRYCSPEMDAAQRAALATYDQSARKAQYSTIQKLIARDVPEIVIWYPRFPQAINPDFKGFAPNPVSEAWNAYEWEI
ncbi:MAG: peptide ABC transporter substrate-binding protein [Candidatus Velthaea sp.]